MNNNGSSSAGSTPLVETGHRVQVTLPPELRDAWAIEAGQKVHLGVFYLCKVEVTPQGRQPVEHVATAVPRGTTSEAHAEACQKAYDKALAGALRRCGLRVRDLAAPAAPTAGPEEPRYRNGLLVSADLRGVYQSHVHVTGRVPGCEKNLRAWQRWCGESQATIRSYTERRPRCNVAQRAA